MSNYDNKNSGAMFPPHETDKIIRQGEINIEGTEQNYSLVQATLPSGKVIFKLMREVGVVFANTDKKSEKHPDMSGNFTENGREYQIAGWKKVSKTGMSYTSISVTPPETKEPENPNTPQHAGSDADPTTPVPPPENSDDVIPF